MKIHNTYNTKVIFEGEASTIREIVEMAIAEDIDLRGANLRGAYLRGADLRGAKLEGANLSWADLVDSNLRDADLNGANLSRANLRDADLRWANLRGADLTDAILEGANLKGTILEGDRAMRRRNFLKLLGVATVSPKVLNAIAENKHEVFTIPNYTDTTRINADMNYTYDFGNGPMNGVLVSKVPISDSDMAWINNDPFQYYDVVAMHSK